MNSDFWRAFTSFEPFVNWPTRSSDVVGHSTKCVAQLRDSNVRLRRDTWDRQANWKGTGRIAARHPQSRCHITMRYKLSTGSEFRSEHQVDTRRYTGCCIHWALYADKWNGKILISTIWIIRTLDCAYRSVGRFCALYKLINFHLHC